MPKGSMRVQKLTPWYHEQMPRCITITLAREQCSYSAKYVDPTGRITVCKVHADMMPDIVFKPLRPKRINIYVAANGRSGKSDTMPKFMEAR